MNLFIARLLLRITLAAGFLSAVADRFGFWGESGTPNVAWGDWPSFVEYVAFLNAYAPPEIIPTLAWIATIAEVVIAVGLFIGWKLRWFAMASGILLLTFCITMALYMGIKAPLDYSVFGVAAASFALAAMCGKK